MIEINKDLKNIPASLAVPPKGKSSKAHEVRKTMFRTKNYAGKSADDCYKADDVKNRLEKLYNHKCAYCEQRVEQYHVEHYRPKKKYNGNEGQEHDGYYWISLSWDNLMLSCPVCNQCKGSKFDIQGPRMTLGSKRLNKDINTWSLAYDKSENPLLINPERDTISGHFQYNEKGEIFPVKGDQRAEYTINTCQLNRRNLCDCRRAILKDFIKKVIDRIFEYDNSHDREIAIDSLFKDFVKDSNDKDKEFLEYRRFMVKHIKPVLQQFI